MAITRTGARPASRRMLRRKPLALLVIAAALLVYGCQPAARSAAPAPNVDHLIYAAQPDGTVHVYDIDHAHRLLKVVPVFGCCADVRGAAAAATTHRYYVMYNKDNNGHVAALDLLTDRVLWDKVLHSPGVDRGNLTPDGKKLYLPTWESDPNSPYELVVDASSGTELARIPLPPRSHDTIVSVDGRRVFMETKSPTSQMFVADTATDRVVGILAGYCCGGLLGPFAINGAGTRIVNDVYGYSGFVEADVASGHVIASVPFASTSASQGHGIAWTPNEREVWVNDGSSPSVHVFDMTARPSTESHLVTVTNPGPHWVTFSIDGRFAYVAGRKGAGDPTDVIDTRTYERVAALGSSEDLLEVDFVEGAVTDVGNQFGIGRVPAR